MKNKLLLLLSILLTTVFAVSACSSFPSQKVAIVPDSGYAVTSNGGTAVQVGDVLYFVNGYKDITDTEGKNNKWGEVVKGGIYATKLISGESITVKDNYYSGKDGYKTYSMDKLEYGEDNPGFEINTAEYTNDTKETVTHKYIGASPIVPKLITSAGNGQVSGIYIIDGYIYYTTPNNLKNRKGEVQYNLVDFMRTSIDGKTTQLLYTSKDSSSKPSYGYYHYNDATYLTVFESALSDKPIYTIKATAKKVSKAKKIAENVQSVVFCAKDVFYKGMSENTAEDFIYYTMVDKANDRLNKVNVMRPDGQTIFEILSGANYTIDKVSQGYLMYSHTERGNHYYSAGKISVEKLEVFEDGMKERAIVEETLVFDNTASDNSQTYTNIYGMIKLDSQLQDELMFIANDINGDLYWKLASNESNNNITTRKLLSGKKIDVMAVDGNYIYYVEKVEQTDNQTAAPTDFELKRLNYMVNQEEDETTFDLDNNINILFGNKVDIAAGYVFYVSTNNIMPGYAETTSNYLKLQKLSGSKGIEWDLAVIDEADLPKKDDAEQDK